FRQHGYEPEVVPGLSSALSGPALCGIPVTHRGVADQVLLMSGSNRQGELPQIPPYLSTRTLVILMSVKRLAVLVELLTKQHHYPADLPVAMVERAGCTDQRMVKGTLETIIEIVERVGANPPGLIVVGHAINVLYGTDASQEEGSGIVQDRYRQTSLLGFYAGESAASALSY
ncbi:uroporphyrin-III C-methyltransferase, partial [Spiromyces aspiralis]